MSERPYDIIVFGATGFTGKFVVEELSQLSLKSKFTWAIAGRSEEGLNKIADFVRVSTQKTAMDHSTEHTPHVIIANVNDSSSLEEMCSRGKVLIDCVGPFRKFGEQVVKACIAKKCDYVDITGEPEYVERMMALHHEDAKRNGVTIVHACGFDSIPADLGVLFTKQELDKREIIPSSVEMYFRLYPGPSGAAAHYATYESLVYGISSVQSLRELRKQMKRPRVPVVGPKLRFSSRPRYDSRVNAWTFPFFFADPSIVRATQQITILEEDVGQTPPVQFSAYIVIDLFCLHYVILLYLLLMVLGFLANYEWGRNLLLAHPKLFTYGAFSHEGPTVKQIEEAKFSSTFYAKGYSKSQHADIEVDQLKYKQPDVELTTRVQGGEPGYHATPICVVQSALVLLESKEKGIIPSGVLTPAAAFAKTNLIEKLNQRGVEFLVYNP
ncbi:sccpdhb protein [Basidiobolus meristosporus CBS 931.73]|uniref:Sccpdhb protein n=1 Tax=Basidiobolus meristosporus CBS 931.73 TaxID=1314790 RepID=A0A1Y1ZE66_9FUNG|nr:sccpdhb protein [Basidiobolus meristosporus CBS 931.73]|eukprot:ORY08257.1 sccpdhb protein [Basidiobolus meristosporus CBS 931.73]